MIPQKTKRSLLPFGFTLVELIVVITILAILGTIGFISIQGYSSSARDSARISNLVNLHKGLTLFQTVGGSYPMPESPITITASGAPIGYQGFAKDQVAGIVKLSAGATKDPLDPTIYTTYSVNKNQTKMQLMVFQEDGSTVTASLEKDFGILKTYAGSNENYVYRTPMTKWDTLGILLGFTGSSLNQPVQEAWIWVDVVLTNTGYTAVFWNRDKKINWTGSILQVMNDSMNNRSINLIDDGCCTFENDTTNGFDLYAWWISDVLFNVVNSHNTLTLNNKKVLYVKTSTTINWGGTYGGVYRVLNSSRIIHGIDYSIIYSAKSLSWSYQIHFSLQNGGGDENCLSNTPTINNKWKSFAFSCKLDFFKGQLYIYTDSPSKEFFLDDIKILPTVLVQ